MPGPCASVACATGPATDAGQPADEIGRDGTGRERVDVRLLHRQWSTRAADLEKSLIFEHLRLPVERRRELLTAQVTTAGP